MRATISLFGQTWEYTPVAPQSASASNRTSTRLMLRHEADGPTFKLLPEGLFDNGWIIGVDAVMVNAESPIRSAAEAQPQVTTTGLLLKHLAPTALAHIALDLQESVDNANNAADAEPYTVLRNLVLDYLINSLGRPSAVETLMRNAIYATTTKAQAVIAAAREP